MPKHFIRALMALFIIILPAEKATAIDSATKAGIIDSIKHTLATAVMPYSTSATVPKESLLPGRYTASPRKTATKGCASTYSGT